MTFWDLKAPLYRWFRAPFPLNIIHNREQEMVLALLSHIPQAALAGPVLDLGCGVGESPVYGSGITTGMDKSPAMLRHASNRNRLLLAGDAQSLPFREASLSVITAIGLSEYIRDLDGLYKECARCLAPGGYLLLTGSPPTWFTRLRAVGGNTIYHRSDQCLLSTAGDWFHPLSVQKLNTMYALLLQYLPER